MRKFVSTITAAAAFWALVLSGACSTKGGITTVDRFPEGKNSSYPSVGAPLVSQQLVKLPVGSIKPQGWIRRQMELSKDGLCGHLGELSSWLEKDNNAWLGNGGQWGWEEVPYWLRGYASLAYAFDDPEMLAETRLWIEAILASQREDGYFGPDLGLEKGLMRGKVRGTPDLWPNMVALWILQDYCEYTSDERIIPFMLKYFHYIDQFPAEQLYSSYWENTRAGDNLWSALWLYSRTGEDWLVPLAGKIFSAMADWTAAPGLPNWHNVNIAESFRAPAEYYMFTRDSALLKATYDDFRLVRRAFGQVPGGMFGADENARLGYFDPRQGTETCALAEQMASDELLMLMTGDPLWAENCENVAFNTLPAAFMPDYRSLRYITSPNMTVSDEVNHCPSIHNAGPFLAMNPFSSRCCQHNHGFAWPYYSQYLAFATPDDGAAVLMYNSCEARVKVAGGTEVVLREETHYPFEETVRFTVSAPSEVSFPLYLRIPSWCRGASVKVCGHRHGNIPSGKYARIEREWKDGDVVELTLPMELGHTLWQVNKNSVSLEYGPLTLSLEIGEDYREHDGRQAAMFDSHWQKDADPSAWPSWSITASTPWNYAIDLSDKVSMERRPWPSDDNPFTLEAVPLRFRSVGYRVPSWGLDRTGMTDVLPEEDAPRSDTPEEIALVPMGAARLRISAFPQK